MGKDLISMRISSNDEQRRRLALKPYFEHDQPIEFVGYLDDIHLGNLHIGQRLYHRRYWCLAVDLHQVDVGKFDRVNLNHVHFSTHDKKMLDQKHQFIYIRANVYKYQSLYRDKKETRFGLRNVELLPFKQAWLDGLDVKYQDKLSVHQKECLLAIRHLLQTQRMAFHMPTLAPLENHINGILQLKEVNDFAKRTEVLTKLANDLQHGGSVRDFSTTQQKIVSANVQPTTKVTKKDLKLKALQADVKTLQKQVRFDQAMLEQYRTLNTSYLNRLTKLTNRNKILSNQNHTLTKKHPLAKAVLGFASIFHRHDLKSDDVISKPETPVVEAIEAQRVDEKALQQLKAKFDNQ